jgi:hypothetical protein
VGPTGDERMTRRLGEPDRLGFILGRSLNLPSWARLKISQRRSENDAGAERPRYS